MMTFFNPATFEGAIFFAMLALVFAWAISTAIRLGVVRVLRKDSRIHIDRTRALFMSQLTQILVYIVVFFIYAHFIPAISGLGNLGLASVGALSVIAGFAAQNTLSNLIAGISLLIYRPFNVGDRLQVNAPTGLETAVVESLTIGYTLLKTDDNRRVVVPNNIMAGQTTINLTRDDTRVVCSIPILISHDADLDKARAILLDIAQHNRKTQSVNGCPVTALDGFGVTLTLSVWCSDSVTASGLRNELLEQTKRRFSAEGIKIPRKYA